MKIRPARRVILLMLALALSVSNAAHADESKSDRRDHERARWAREQGHVRPLAEILDQMRGELRGEIVGVELEEDDGRYAYEFKVITPEGRLREIHVDAMTAKVLSSEED